jgi:hypothetical protein
VRKGSAFPANNYWKFFEALPQRKRGVTQIDYGNVFPKVTDFPHIGRHAEEIVEAAGKARR